MKKKVLSLLLALIMVLSLMPTAAFAAEEADTQPVESGVIADVQTDAITESGVERLLEEGKIEGSLTQKPMLAGTDNGYYTDLLDAVALLREKMVDRTQSITVPVRVSKKDVSNLDEMSALAVLLVSVATSHTGAPKEGDYLLWGIRDMDFGGTYSENSKYYYIDYKFSFSYRLSGSHEANVTNSINAIMAGFNFTENTDDYGKALAIYDYICSRVKNCEAGSDTVAAMYKDTAYGALSGEADARGYALLLYRMMLEAGIDCRIIAGYDAETDAEHYWNIVGLDGAYYNVDATWDAGYIDYGYFLKGSNNFTDHIREAVFDSEEFHTLHPTAKEDYVPADPAIIASGSCGESAAYTIYSDGYMEITGTGAMTNWASADEVPWKDYRSYVRYVSVADGITSVGSYAFANCKYMLFIELPDSIAEIGGYAFSNARMLMFVVPTGLKKIGQNAFNIENTLGALVIQDLAGWLSIETDVCLTADTWYLGEEELKEVAIPEGMTAIRDYAFYDSDITSVHVPDSVTYIGKRAFYKVTTLTNVTGGCNKVSKIGASAFYRTSLTEISLDSITEIGASAFGECKQLKKVTLGPGLTTVGGGAFESAPIKTVDIGDLQGWCMIQFPTYSANPLNSGADLYLNGEPLTDLVVPDGVTAIHAHAFYGANITSLVLPDSVKSVGGYAFYNTELVTADLGSSVQEVASSAFCSAALTDVTIPASLKNVGWNAFYNNKNMRLHLESLDTWYNLQIGDEDAMGTASILCMNGEPITEIVIPEGTVTLRNYLFYQIANDMTVQLPSTLTSIGTNAFAYSGLREIEIPDNVEKLGKYAFSNSAIEKVTVGKKLTTLEWHAFYECENLKSITFKEGLEKVGHTALGNCTSLTSITFPESLKELDHYALSNCKSLKDVYFKGNAPKVVTYNTFSGTTQATLHYSCTKEGWKYFSNNISLKCVTDHNEVIDAAVPATCSATGLTEGKHCADCGEVLVAQTVTGKLPHTPVNGICSVCGEETVFFTQQPQSVMVKSGKTAKVTVAAEGEGLKYAWYWAPAGSDDFQLTTSFKSTSYSITMNESRDGRQVFCRVTDKFGSFVDSDIVTLNMAKPPVITRELTYGYAKKGEEIVVDFEATGNGELTYTWYYANAGSSTYKKTTSFTGPEYSVEMSDSRAGRKVYCVVTDAFGLSTKTKTATLRMELEIVNDLADASAVSGKKASVTVKANGQGLKYEWYYSDGGEFKKTTSFKTATYSLSMNEARDGRQVYCKITDKYGNSVQTATATLSMVPPPQIVVEPTYAYAKKGEEAVVSFEATGTGELTYEWYWAKAGSSTYKKTTSFTGPEYKVEMDDSRAGRKVYCVVTDETGASVKTKTVTLRMALEITEDLADVTVDAGKKAAVTVKANGQGLKYEWFYSDNGGEFKKTTSFKTATYSLTMNEARDGRQVFCRITDKYGNTVQTATATLGMN